MFPSWASRNSFAILIRERTKAKAWAFNQALPSWLRTRRSGARVFGFLSFLSALDGYPAWPAS